MGMAGSAARTFLATRRQKSGLSMVIRQSGFCAAIALAVWPIRRISRGRSRTTALTPIKAISPASNSDFSPSACKCLPPMPTRRMSRPVASRSARTRSAPSRSPDSSPATTPIVSARSPTMAFFLWRQTDDEQAKRIGPLDHGGTIENERMAGLHGDARQAGGMRALNRVRADGRQIGPRLLAGLGAFDQNAARLAGQTAVPAQIPDAGKQAVRRLDALQCNHPAADCHRALPDIQRADRLGSGAGGIDIAPIRRLRSNFGVAAFERHQFGHDLMRADDLDAAPLDIAQDGPQQPVVAARKLDGQARQGYQQAGVQAHLRQARPSLDLAGQNHMRD